MSQGTTTAHINDTAQPQPEVLVLAPTGIDARLICTALGSAGLKTTSCQNIQEISARIGNDTGVAVLCEEVLRGDGAELLASAVRRQPSWSAIPIILLASAAAARSEARMYELRRLLGQVTLLERPVHPASLLASVDVGLHARERQYEIRQYMADREEAAKALRAGEQRYRSLVAASASVVWVTDAAGTLLADNDPWYSFTGLSRQERNFTAAVHPVERRDVTQDWREAVKSGNTFQCEFRLQVAEDGWCRVSAKAVPVRNENGAIREWIGACIDIEKQRRAEDALRHSERLALAGRMAASIAHEINNPLEAVTNLLYLIDQTDDVNAIRSFGCTAQQELRRVVDIVAQTLSYYRQTSSPTEHVAADLLESVLVLLRARIRSRNIRVETRYRSAPRLRCYAGEVKQVFANLLTNAVDAMPNGGRLVIAVRSGEGTSGQYVRITIADSGSGIAEEIRASLFQPFVTTKGSNGTGLGLWITHEVLKKHRARVRIKSRTSPGRSGTVFSLTFPVASSVHPVSSLRDDTQKRGKDRRSAEVA